MAEHESLKEMLEEPRLWGWVDAIEAGVFEEIPKNKPPTKTITKSNIWPGLDLHCGVCGSEATFACGLAEKIRGTRNNGSDFPLMSTKWLKTHYLTASYCCQRCQNYEVTFFLTCRDYEEKGKAKKTGRFLTKFAVEPAIRSRPSKETTEALKKIGMYNLYAKGLQCENHDLGIGACGYYRRIVESIIAMWIEELTEKVGEADHQAWLDSFGERKPRMHETIDRLEAHMGSFLRPGGHNLLDELYTTLSEGIHSLSDEDSLIYGRLLRVQLEWTINAAHRAKEDETLFLESVKALKKLKSHAGQSD